MLIIGKSNRTTVPATIRVRDEGGQVQAIPLQLTGPLRTQPDWDALYTRHAAAEDQDRSVTAIYRANARLFADAFDGWQGVAGADGQPLAFSAEAVEVLLLSEHGPAANVAFMAALQELRYGALEKN